MNDLTLSAVVHAELQQVLAFTEELTGVVHTVPLDSPAPRGRVRLVEESAHKSTESAPDRHLQPGGAVGHVDGDLQR